MADELTQAERDVFTPLIVDVMNKFKELPNNIEAEQAVIGSVLTSNEIFDDINVINGQGTLMLEMLEDCPQIDTLLVPVGGGGLLSGCSLISKPHFR